MLTPNTAELYIGILYYAENSLCSYYYVSLARLNSNLDDLFSNVSNDSRYLCGFVFLFMAYIAIHASVGLRRNFVSETHKNRIFLLFVILYRVIKFIFIYFNID